MLAIKKKTESPPKYSTGWHYGAMDLLEDIVSCFNCMESEGFIVCNVDIEEVYGGGWKFIYKIVEK